MKIAVTFLLTWILCSCNYNSDKGNDTSKNTIISKVKFKRSSAESDTLWVSQNDSTFFRKEDVLVQRPCSNPEFQIHYEMLKPINDAYYYIYNDKQQLISEGKYTQKYTYEGATKMSGNFYDEKSYYYRNNGKLKMIHYMKDGRNDKTESYDRKKRLTEITYFDKKSSNKEKVEIYDKGKLQETRIYKSFDTYVTEKAN